jgi:hypothetical protein
MVFIAAVVFTATNQQPNPNQRIEQHQRKTREKSAQEFTGPASEKAALRLASSGFINPAQKPESGIFPATRSHSPDTG